MRNTREKREERADACGAVDRPRFQSRSSRGLVDKKGN